MKVLAFVPHDTPNTGGGTLVYCKALEELFQNSEQIEYFESEILPHSSRLGLKYDKEILKDYIRRVSPHIIHINGYTSQLVKQIVPVAKKLGIKLIYTAHWHPFETMRHPILKRLYFNIYVKPYLKYFDAIICINKEDSEFFRQFSDRVHMIPHWIKGENRKRNDIQRVKNQIIFVGSLVHPNKGFKYLNNLPEGKYHIVCISRRGNATLRSDMVHLTNVSDEELHKLYSQSSLLVIPSLYEAFSYAALEALSVGTPVVMSERVRISDYLKDFDGIKIFNISSPDEFREAVESTIGKSITTDQILKIFSKEKAFNSYSNLFMNLMNES